MGPRKGKLMLAWTSGVFVLLLSALAACAEVEVVDRTPAVRTPDTFSSPLATGQGIHNLAVLAVDFDPPLNYQQLIIHSESITLLVVVENTGSGAERDVTVQAQLTTPDDSSFHLAQRASLARIAPGEIQIARFAPLGEIPYHQTYRLEVTVDPVEGESDLSDNSRAFEIQIRQE